MTEKEYYWWKSMIKKYEESRIAINCIAILFLVVVWYESI